MHLSVAGTVVTPATVKSQCRARMASHEIGERGERDERGPQHGFAPVVPF